METFSAAPTPRPVVLRAFTLLWHNLLCTPQFCNSASTTTVLWAPWFWLRRRRFSVRSVISPPITGSGETRGKIGRLWQLSKPWVCIMIHLYVKKSGAVYSVLEVISSSLQGNVALSIWALPLWVYRHASLYIGKWVKKSTPKSFSFKEQPIATRGYQHNSTRSLAWQSKIK